MYCDPRSYNLWENCSSIIFPSASEFLLPISLILKNLAQEVMLRTAFCRFLARISAKKLIVFAETFIVSVSALGECMGVRVYFVIILDRCLLDHFS
jgi:hypothetical protein